MSWVSTFGLPCLFQGGICRIEPRSGRHHDDICHQSGIDNRTRQACPAHIEHTHNDNVAIANTACRRIAGIDVKRCATAHFLLQVRRYRNGGQNCASRASIPGELDVGNRHVGIAHSTTIEKTILPVFILAVSVINYLRSSAVSMDDSPVDPMNRIVLVPCSS